MSEQSVKIEHRYLELPDGMDPIAMKYTGHQFGAYNPELGDGRAVLHSKGSARVRDLFVTRSVADEWLRRYQERLDEEDVSAKERETAMRATNPKYILRNYLAEQVILEARNGDYKPMEALLAVLKRPFDEQPENEQYAAPPPDWGKHLNISCSS